MSGGAPSPDSRHACSPSRSESLLSSDDGGPLRRGIVGGQLEQEGQTGCRRRVHAALVVDRAVEAVEGLVAFLGVRGTQRPQQRRYLLGRAVRVLHRSPVDVMKSVEHDQHHAR